jgi:RNA polymerase sigma factor (sigma-70 family)
MKLRIYSLIITGNTKATNTLIESNLKLVVHFAKQYKNYINQNEAFDIDDLISEGNIGLIKSIPSLTELNVKFSFTLLFYIKKYIQDF